MLHVQVNTGGLFSGKIATLWDLDEAAFVSRILEPRARGESVWINGEEFAWPATRVRVFEGPATSELEDNPDHSFSKALGPTAYTIIGLLVEVTDRYITGAPGVTRDESDSGAPRREAIFLVHGRNLARREEVARFVSQIAPAYELIIMSDIANEGRTLLEKFEQIASSSVYAIVVLTPDDEGRLAGSGNWEGRARQNVIFELGFFFGKLGRGRVAALVESGVSKMSDIDGLGHIPLDESGGWKVLLARELRGAGVDASLDRIT